MQKKNFNVFLSLEVEPLDFCILNLNALLI